MAFNLSKVKWVWVALGVILAFVIAYAASICVVTGYASVLAFQSRGAPDMTAINGFAGNYAEGIVSIFIGLGTLAGGYLATRRAKDDTLSNGLAVGGLTALCGLLLSLLGGFNLWALVALLLALAGGWLGGTLARRRA